ncbi:dihydropteroate synthase [Lewinella cohaerens]|uniref:dihydropteroate synthase n=1 Tax=Lewinella cohaerens TaxID=70995 RepID=UPI0003694155|nr:dihydropteroate synthase [Lewinella cohaerens]
MIFPQETLNCDGTLLDLGTPKIMGVINVTPDSFYADSRQEGLDDILRAAEKMLADGADLLDIGGMSSRPGAEVISADQELHRVIAPIKAIMQRFPEAIVSIDTVHAKVAKEAVATGASLVNDISAGRIDPEMYDAIAELGVPYVLMHMRGTPETMQKQVDYENIVQEILDFFITEVTLLRQKGVKDIVIDPGFGFGKTIRQNYELLNDLNLFQILEVPVLIGVSRKSMIYKLLNCSPLEALNGSSVVHLLALQNDAKILRVHDVKEAAEVIKIWKMMEDVKTTGV